MNSKEGFYSCGLSTLISKLSFFLLFYKAYSIKYGRYRVFKIPAFFTW